MLAKESEGHSRNVKRRRLDVTTVRGPVGELSVCFEYRLINDLINVVLPTPGGPTTVTIIGGASSGRRSSRTVMTSSSPAQKLSNFDLQPEKSGQLNDLFVQVERIGK